ncbi:DUF262 domain-containing protein [Termitidicoccus mucosus]|uniref:DUF262 domain-containing protein n=1 Tax=Termitidicoccus mucosus TaxID=1184151 RepID=UPI003183403C
MTEIQNINEILSEIDSDSKDQDTEQLPALEDKYSVQMRQIVTQKIELPISTLPVMLEPKKGQIDLSPDFQRRSIWDIERRSRFIESIIMNIPIPPVFLGEVDYGTYAVLDGRQRLTAIYEFLRNNFKLRNLRVWSELNDKSFADLQDDGLDKYFTRRFVPAVVVLKESSPQVKYDVFDRLNTGGVVALPMEIRNAVFPGKFNKTLHDLSINADFLKLWQIPATGSARGADPVFNRMFDLELVLRFFAVPAYQGGLKFKDFLSDFMASRNQSYESDPVIQQHDRQRFEVSCKNTLAVFGTDAFQRPIAGGGRKKNKSAPLADAIMNALADVLPAKLTPDIILNLRHNLDNLCLTPEFARVTTAGTNGKGAIETRLRLAKEIVMSTIA